MPSLASRYSETELSQERRRQFRLSRLSQQQTRLPTRANLFLYTRRVRSAARELRWGWSDRLTLSQCRRIVVVKM